MSSYEVECRLCDVAVLSCSEAVGNQISELESVLISVVSGKKLRKHLRVAFHDTSMTNVLKRLEDPLFDV